MNFNDAGPEEREVQRSTQQQRTSRTPSRSRKEGSGEGDPPPSSNVHASEFGGGGFGGGHSNNSLVSQGSPTAGGGGSISFASVANQGAKMRVDGLSPDYIDEALLNFIRARKADIETRELLVQDEVERADMEAQVQRTNRANKKAKKAALKAERLREKSKHEDDSDQSKGSQDALDDAASTASGAAEKLRARGSRQALWRLQQKAAPAGPYKRHKITGTYRIAAMEDTYVVFAQLRYSATGHSLILLALGVSMLIFGGTSAGQNWTQVTYIMFPLGTVLLVIAGFTFFLGRRWRQRAEKIREARENKDVNSDLTDLGGVGDGGFGDNTNRMNKTIQHTNRLLFKTRIQTAKTSENLCIAGITIFLLGFAGTDQKYRQDCFFNRPSRAMICVTSVKIISLALVFFFYPLVEVRRLGWLALTCWQAFLMGLTHRLDIMTGEVLTTGTGTSRVYRSLTTDFTLWLLFVVTAILGLLLVWLQEEQTRRRFETWIELTLQQQDTDRRAGNTNGLIEAFIPQGSVQKLITFQPIHHAGSDVVIALCRISKFPVWSSQFAISTVPELLNMLYTFFDQQRENYKLQLLRNYGDSYLVSTLADEFSNTSVVGDQERIPDEPSSGNGSANYDQDDTGPPTHFGETATQRTVRTITFCTKQLLAMKKVAQGVSAVAGVQAGNARLTGGIDLSVQIGVSTGTLVGGLFGGDQKLYWNVGGPAYVEASNLCRDAPDAQILAGPRAVELTAAHFTYQLHKPALYHGTGTECARWTLKSLRAPLRKVRAQLMAEISSNSPKTASNSFSATSIHTVAHRASPGANSTSPIQVPPPGMGLPLDTEIERTNTIMGASTQSQLEESLEISAHLKWENSEGKKKKLAVASTKLLTKHEQRVLFLKRFKIGKYANSQNTGPTKKHSSTATTATDPRQSGGNSSRFASSLFSGDMRSDRTTHSSDRSSINPNPLQPGTHETEQGTVAPQQQQPPRIQPPPPIPPRSAELVLTTSGHGMQIDTTGFRGEEDEYPYPVLSPHDEFELRSNDKGNDRGFDEEEEEDGDAFPSREDQMEVYADAATLTEELASMKDNFTFTKCTVSFRSIAAEKQFWMFIRDDVAKQGRYMTTMLPTIIAALVATGVKPNVESIGATFYGFVICAVISLVMWFLPESNRTLVSNVTMYGSVCLQNVVIAFSLMLEPENLYSTSFNWYMIGVVPLFEATVTVSWRVNLVVTFLFYVLLCVLNLIVQPLTFTVVMGSFWLPFFFGIIAQSKERQRRTQFLLRQISTQRHDEVEVERQVHEALLGKILPAYVVSVVATRLNEAADRVTTNLSALIDTDGCVVDALSDLAILSVRLHLPVLTSGAESGVVFKHMRHSHSASHSHSNSHSNSNSPAINSSSHSVTAELRRQVRTELNLSVSSSPSGASGGAMGVDLLGAGSCGHLNQSSASAGSCNATSLGHQTAGSLAQLSKVDHLLSSGIAHVQREKTQWWNAGELPPNDAMPKRDQVLISIIRIEGDEATIAGPLQTSTLTLGKDGPASQHGAGQVSGGASKNAGVSKGGQASSVGVSKAVGADFNDLVFGNRADEVTTELLTLGAYLRDHVRVTGVFGRGDTTAVVLGQEQPRFDLVGYAPRVNAALVAAAPEGSFWGTDCFIRWLPGGANSLQRYGGWESGTPSMWRVQGAGMTAVVPMSRGRVPESRGGCGGPGKFGASEQLNLTLLSQQESTTEEQQQ